MSRLYRPLSFDTYEVRLLKFAATYQATPIECTMHTVSLIDHPPQYVALSYCWGDVNETTDILVNGVTTAITLNLEAALRQLRGLLGTNVMLWADALCINQKDNQERSQQVRLMTQIYATARSCCAWLGGQEYQDIRAALLIVRELDIPFPKDEKTAQKAAVQAACASFLSICRSPYWQRRWVIQELTAAKDVDLICMDLMIPFGVVRFAYDMCSLSEFWLAEHGLATDFFKHIKHFRQDYQENQELSLIPAMIGTQRFLSQDSRDKIFALMGICADGPALVPAPNYAQSIGDISRDLTRALLRRHANFDLILLDQKTESHPTWALDWCSSRLTEVAGTVANTKGLWPRYLAASALRADSDTLRMEGVTLGTIISLSSPLSWDASDCVAATSHFSMSLPRRQSPGAYYRSKGEISRVLQDTIFSNAKTESQYHRDGHAVNKDAKAVFSAWLDSNDQLLYDGSHLNSHLKISSGLISAKHRKTMHLVNGCAVICLVACIIIIAALNNPSTGATVILVLLMGASGLAILAILLVVLVKLMKVTQQRWQLFSPLGLSRVIETSCSLYVLDTGLIGKTSAPAQVGDKLCFLAGCTTPAILRPHKQEGGTVVYGVVGSSATVQLNAVDQKKFGGFLPDPHVHALKGEAYKTEFQKKWEEYKTSGWLESFTIV